MKFSYKSPIVVIACFLGIFLQSIDTAPAAVVVTMLGTVEEGSLNGTDLAGSFFSYEALINDTTDIDDVFPNTGTFVVDSARLDFGARGLYDFGAQPGFFNWGISGRNFYAYSVLNVDVPTTSYTDGFGFSDTDTSISGFDPAVLTDFGPYDQFDTSWTFDTAAGPFTASNGLGDTIVMSRLGTSGILAVTAVPEPASGFALLCIAGMGTLRRRRPPV